MKLLVSFVLTVFGVVFGLACIVSGATSTVRIGALVWIATDTTLMIFQARKL